jgi:hypothetical protein
MSVKTLTKIVTLLSSLLTELDIVTGLAIGRLRGTSLPG